eukprot:16438021-Heterocapsa_arctica.AAC.1
MATAQEGVLPVYREEGDGPLRPVEDELTERVEPGAPRPCRSVGVSVSVVEQDFHESGTIASNGAEPVLAGAQAGPLHVMQVRGPQVTHHCSPQWVVGRAMTGVRRVPIMVPMYVAVETSGKV